MATVYLPLADKISRTTDSYYRHTDRCPGGLGATPDSARIASAIERLRAPGFRERVLTWSNGTIDTFTPVDPKTCCRVEFGGMHSEYGISFWGIWRNEATAAVYIDSLPANPVTRKHLHVLTDACGNAFEWGD